MSESISTRTRIKTLGDSESVLFSNSQKASPQEQGLRLVNSYGITRPFGKSESISTRTRIKTPILYLDVEYYFLSESISTRTRIKTLSNTRDVNSSPVSESISTRTRIKTLQFSALSLRLRSQKASPQEQGLRHRHYSNYQNPLYSVRKHLHKNKD